MASITNEVTPKEIPHAIKTPTKIAIPPYTPHLIPLKKPKKDCKSDNYNC